MKYIPVHDAEEVRQRIFEISRNRSFDFVDIDEKDRRIIAWGKRYLKGRSIRAKLRRIGKKQYAANLKRGSLRKKERKEEKAVEIAGKIDELYEGFKWSYETLMKWHKDSVVWATKWMKDDKNVQKRLKKLKKRALVTSVRNVAKENSRLTVSYLSKNHPGIEKAAREVYSSGSMSAGYKLIKDSGIEYPIEYFRKNIRWSIGDLMKAVSDIEDSEDFLQRTVNSAVWQAAKGRLKRAGKLAMLVGIDYLQRKGIDKKKFSFTKKELLKVLRDRSLEPDERVTGVFNALCLQYYGLEKYESSVKRELGDYVGLSAQVIDKIDVLNDNIEIYLSAYERENKGYIVGISLGNRIENLFDRFHVKEFHFSGEDADNDVADFYSGLEGRCDGLKVGRR